MAKKSIQPSEQPVDEQATLAKEAEAKEESDELEEKVQAYFKENEAVDSVIVTPSRLFGASNMRLALASVGGDRDLLEVVKRK